MTRVAVRAVRRARGLTPSTAPGRDQPGSRRHPLVATAMVVPVAVLLAVAFGGWHAVVVEASSVAGVFGR